MLIIINIPFRWAYFQQIIYSGVLFSDGNLHHMLIERNINLRHGRHVHVALGAESNNLISTLNVGCISLGNPNLDSCIQERILPKFSVSHQHC